MLDPGGQAHTGAQLARIGIWHLHKHANWSSRLCPALSSTKLRRASRSRAGETAARCRSLRPHRALLGWEASLKLAASVTLRQLLPPVMVDWGAHRAPSEPAQGPPWSAPDLQEPPGAVSGCRSRCSARALALLTPESPDRYMPFASALSQLRTGHSSSCMVGTMMPAISSCRMRCRKTAMEPGQVREVTQGEQRGSKVPADGQPFIELVWAAFLIVLQPFDVTESSC